MRHGPLRKLLIPALSLQVLFSWAGCNDTQPGKPHLEVLIELQRESQVAKTEADRQAIIQRLKDHYLSLGIEESIRSEIEKIVEGIEVGPLAPFAGLDSSNLAVSENRLEEHVGNLLLQVLAGRGEGLGEDWRKAARVAAFIDRAAGVHYWGSLVAAASGATPRQAKFWKMAVIAGDSCSDLVSSEFRRSEQFGAFCLQALRDSGIPDWRRELTVFQRFLVILSESYSLYDLSYVLAEVKIPEAENIGYILRAVGLEYNFTNALILDSRVSRAHQAVISNLQRVQRHSEVPGIDWYASNSKLNLAKTYCDLGEHQKALKILDTLKLGTTTLPRETREMIELNIERGINLFYLGNYEQAKAAYDRAYQLAVEERDGFNHHIVLNNLGDFYENIGLYHKAIHYYQQAIEIQSREMGGNIGLKLILTVRLAEVMGAYGDRSKHLALINKVQEELGRVANSDTRAEIIRSIGRVNMELQRWSEAQDNLNQAIRQYAKIGLFRAELDTRIDLIRTLIVQGRDKEAESLLDRVQSAAESLSYQRCIIDALAIRAQLARISGDFATANSCGDRLLSKIEMLNRGLTDVDFTIGYRHHIDKYLKETVLNELLAGNQERAYQKLNRIKKLTQMRHSNVSQPHTSAAAEENAYIKGALVFNYLIVETHLYLFVEGGRELKLKQRKIDPNKLEEQIDRFVNSIGQSRLWIDRSPPQQQQFYDSTMQAGGEIYRQLFGWPDIETELRQAAIVQIIPDGPLHKIPFYCLPLDERGSNRFLIQLAAIAKSDHASIFNNSYATGVDYRQGRAIYAADESFTESKRFISYLAQGLRAAQLSTNLIRGVGISPEQVVGALDDGYNLLFVAAHNLVEADNPENPQLILPVLESDNQRLVDIVISREQLKYVNWHNYDAAILVGCNTEVGDFYRGSGLNGLEQLLSAAGTREILASRWEIDERQAIPQALDYVSLRLQGVHPAVALQKVQLNSIKQLENDPYFVHPYPYLWGSLGLTLN